MPNVKKYETEAKTWIIAKPLLAVAIGVVIGFIIHALLF
jgi:ElaB/YqjD/DUF883 family membrane-anchored ribosome-binding protein